MAKDDFIDDEIRHFDVSKPDGEKIEGSLAKIKYQTSRHLCINTGLSIGTIIEWLDNNSLDVLGEQVGNFWVYYLKKNKPESKKLYFGGADGRTVCLRDKTERGNTGNLRPGQKVVLERPLPAPDEKKMYPRNLPQIDFDEVERLAAENPDKDLIADELEVNRNRFKYELIHNASLKRAYERGKQTFMENQEIIEKNNETETAAGLPPNTLGEHADGSMSRVALKNLLTPAFLESAGLIGKSTARIALDLGLSKADGKRIDGILYDKSRPELVAAWKRGKAMFAEKKPIKREDSTEPPEEVETQKRSDDFLDHRENSENQTTSANWRIVPEIELPHKQRDDCEIEIDPRFRHTLEHIAENGRSREKLEEVKNKLIPQWSEPISGGIEKSVEFVGRLLPPRRPVGLQIGFDGDFFALTEKQRMLLLEMANLNDEFQKENQ